MEIKVRHVDPIAVKKIDELAKQQGISRNIFLANLIQNFAALEEFKDFEERYQTLTNKCMGVIQKNTETQQKVLNIVGDEEK